MIEIISKPPHRIRRLVLTQPRTRIHSPRFPMPTIIRLNSVVLIRRHRQPPVAAAAAAAA